MLTQEIIESKNFQLLQSVIADSSTYTPSDADRTDYVALATHEFIDDMEIPMTLSYYDDGYMILKDYYNDPLFYKEYFFTGHVTTEAELDEVLADTDYTFSLIDLTRLKLDYI